MTDPARSWPPVAVLFGGPSAEHDVSIISGSAISDALAGRGVEVQRVFIDLDRRWWWLPTAHRLDGRPPAAFDDPASLGAGLVVFVQIRLSRTAQDIFAQFKESASQLPEVQECYLVSGNFDYLIKARVADMNEYRSFLGESLLSLPGVQESTSYVVMETVKETLQVAVR